MPKKITDVPEKLSASPRFTPNVFSMVKSNGGEGDLVSIDGADMISHSNFAFGEFEVDSQNVLEHRKNNRQRNGTQITWEQTHS